MDDFKSKWNELELATKNKLWEQAKSRAKHILKKQKALTGVAILGSPAHELDSDVKLQGELKDESLQNGQRLAFASLASEVLVLNTLGIPYSKHFQYTGRAQYPKFSVKPLIQKTNADSDYYVCPHVYFWGQILGFLRFLLKAFSAEVKHESSSGTQINELIRALSQLYVHAEDHVEGLDDEKAATVKVIRQSLLSLDRSICDNLLDSVGHIFNIFLIRNVQKLAATGGITLKRN